jgi:hypothetical protein|tara:strand:- start:105 stop:455 length:351 start_codon:yes stop_codon:yes gene_type:complete
MNTQPLIVDRFKKYLTDVSYPKEKDSTWNIAGVLNNYSNQKFKFDVRDLFRYKESQGARWQKYATRADKVVLEATDRWVIIEVAEMNKYVKKHKLKQVRLEDLMKELEWSIEVPKR